MTRREDQPNDLEASRAIVGSTRSAQRYALAAPLQPERASSSVHREREQARVQAIVPRPFAPKGGPVGIRLAPRLRRSSGLKESGRGVPDRLHHLPPPPKLSRSSNFV
jgi:hypothetical protein